MEYIKLGDLGKIVSGGTPKTDIDEYWNGTNLWITPAELSDDSYLIDNTLRKITDVAIKKSNVKLLPKGTVLLSSRAPIGKVAIANADMYCNQGFKNIICGEKLYNKFLFNFLKYKNEYIQSLGRGATFKEISKEIVSNIMIPIYSVEDQIKISIIFEKISELIRIKKDEIVMCHHLIKSQFVEMFNDNTFEVIGLNELCDVRDGTHDSPKYLDSSKYKFITSKNIVGDSIDFSDCKYIKEDDFNKFNQRSKVNTGDILMPMIGTIGNPIIVNIPEDEIDFAIKNVALIKFNNSSKVTNVYIKSLLNSDFFENAISQNKRGGTQKFIALSDIRKIKVPVPPIELQNKFAQIVEQIDKQKFEFENSLKKLEELQASLMQEYFG